MTTPIAHARKLCRIVAVLGVQLIGVLPATAQQSTGTSFVDNFDRMDRGFWYVSDGWNNGPHQNCTWSKNEAKVEGGMLHLTFTEGQSKDRKYLCGEIQTTKRYG